MATVSIDAEDVYEICAQVRDKEEIPGRVGRGYVRIWRVLASSVGAGPVHSKLDLL